MWTGLQEPYALNSTLAYLNEAETAEAELGRSLLGLTACTTSTHESGAVNEDGFVDWGQYMSEQGGSAGGSNWNYDSSDPSSVNYIKHSSPAPYGAILALPFLRSKAIDALHEYTDIGFYNRYLGFPDNIRMLDLPKDSSGNVVGFTKPVPHWDHFDINMGAAALAIEQTQDNSIGGYYLSDPDISANLPLLIETFDDL